MIDFLCSWTATEWLVLVASLVVVGYIYGTWTFNHWEKRGIPFIKKPVPFMGSLLGMIFGKQFLGHVYVDMYNELKGNVFGGYFKFRQPAIMICDPEVIKSVMVKDFSSFHDNDIDVTIDQDPMFGRNPFCLRGDRWKTVRSQLTPAFTPGKIKPLFPLINEVCGDLVKHLEREGSQIDGLEAKELASKFTTDVVATCAYGLNGNSLNDPKAMFREMGKNILPNTWWSNLLISIFLISPKVAKIFDVRFFNETVTNFFRGVVKDAMSHREKNKVVRNDFLQLLMNLKAKGQVEGDKITGALQEKFTDEDVAAQALTFFSDGFETSATVLCFTLYELAVNGKIQEKLRDEVDNAFKKHGGELNYEMVQEMPYLSMVVDETLRKYPPGSVIFRLCTKRYELTNPGGKPYRVEVGSTIAFPVMGLHLDPKYYPDPEKFDPDRFTEEAKATRHPYTYLPFGGGPRVCIGNRFAMTQIRAGVATIIANFELQLCKRTPVPIVLDSNALLPLAKDGMWIRFIRRNKS